MSTAYRASVMHGPSRFRLLAGLATATVGVLALGSLLTGNPTELPQIALGAPWLLHVERVMAGALAISVLATLIARISAGQLPLKLGPSSIEFEPTVLDDAARVTVELQYMRARIDELEDAARLG
jgi:hypothetical protein